MNRLLIVILLLLPMMPGCWRCNNKCHELCYRSIALSAEPIDGPVKIYEYEDDVERVAKEEFSDCIIRGKSYFSSPYIGAEKLKRFAARIGANVVLCQRNLERAGLDFECQCNPIEIVDPVDDQVDDPNMIRFASVSASVSGSAAAGPGATYIYSHKIWFLYRDKQE